MTWNRGPRWAHRWHRPRPRFTAEAWEFWPWTPLQWILWERSWWPPWNRTWDVGRGDVEPQWVGKSGENCWKMAGKWMKNWQKLQKLRKMQHLEALKCWENGYRRRMVWNQQKWIYDLQKKRGYEVTKQTGWCGAKNQSLKLQWNCGHGDYQQIDASFFCSRKFLVSSPNLGWVYGIRLILWFCAINFKWKITITGRWEFSVNYPLVICYIAIENHHRNSGFSHWTWWFSIVFCKRLPVNYQRLTMNF